MQKIAISVGAPVAPMLERMNPGGWVAETIACADIEIGTLTHPAADALTRAGLAGIKRLSDGDMVVWSGLPLPIAKVKGFGSADDIVRGSVDLDGAFAAIIWAAADMKLTIVSDFLGLQPIYLARDGFAAATDSKAFPYEPDPAGWGAVLSLGHVIGGEGLNANAERLRPAEIVERTFDGNVQRRTYWQWQARTKPPETSDLVAALTANMHDYVAVDRNPQLMLSAGFDSRTVLAICSRDSVPVSARTVRHPAQNGDLERILAHRAAHSVGVTPVDCDPGQDFFSSNEWLDYVWAIEAAFPCHALFIAQMPQFVVDGTATWDGLLTGHSLKTGQQSQRGTFADFKATKVAPEGPRWNLFKPAIRKHIREGFEGAFQASTEGKPDNPDGLWQWIVQNRMRNRAGINPTKAIAARALPFMPGSSQAYWRLATDVLHEERQSGEIFRRLFAENFPVLARTPFESGGKVQAAVSAPVAMALLDAYRAVSAVAAKYPSVGRLIVPTGKAPRLSRFLQHPALIMEEDDWLDMDALRALGPNDPARATLLHWRSVRWLHEGRLHSVLLNRE